MSSIGSSGSVTARPARRSPSPRLASLAWGRAAPRGRATTEPLLPMLLLLLGSISNCQNCNRNRNKPSVTGCNRPKPERHQIFVTETKQKQSGNRTATSHSKLKQSGNLWKPQKHILFPAQRRCRAPHWSPS